MPLKYNPARRLLFNALGIGISVIPASVAIFSYFPMWIERDDASILSGFTLLLFAAALIPLYKHLRDILRSPSAPVMWFIFFVLFFILGRIADEMTVISFVGFVTNLIGSIFFKIAKRYGMEAGNEGRA